MRKNKYRDLYVPEDAEIVYHEFDPDLDTIRIKLPSLKDWYSEQLKREVDYEEALTYVTGYGLHPSEQKFQHQQWPPRLKAIFEIVFDKLRSSAATKSKYKSITDVTQEDVYEFLDENQSAYEDEIKWIKLQQKRRYVGYWVFINGKPTYINGPLYFFLNFWWVKNKNRKDGLPDYRNYQREMFTAYLYAHTTDELYYLYRVVYNEEGKIKEKMFNDWENLKIFEAELVDSGIDHFHQIAKKGEPHVRHATEPGAEKISRTVNGVNFISGRRIGKTDSACCFGFWATTNVPDQLFVIQGLNKDQAVDKIFVNKIQAPFDRLPFFFRPHVRGREDARRGYLFLYDGDMAYAFRAGVVSPPLGSRILPLASSERAADGEEVNFAYIDEPGKELDKKSAERDIPSLWYEVIKPATEIGGDIVGTCIMPTTVGDMESGGGEQFLRMVNDSHFMQRSDNGRTLSGLINIFMSGYNAVPGDYIDCFGATIIDTPKEPVMSITGKLKKIGAREFHQNQVSLYEKSKKFDELNKFLRNYPPDFKSAFSLNMKGMGFTEETLQAMKSRLSDLRFGKLKTTGRINFAWIKEFDSATTELDERGRWTYSHIPPREDWNKKTIVSEEDGYTRLGTPGPIYAPATSVANKFIICFDPVAFDKMNKRGKGGSTPAAAVYYKRDRTLDPDDKPRQEWKSQDYVAFIALRTDNKDEIYEEILKAAVLYGAYIYPEMNAGEDFLTWIRKKGYDGYMLKDTEEKDGRRTLAKVPGVWADQQTIGDMILKMADFFKKNVRYMKIPEIIEDWLKMRGVDDLTNRDLAAASGWCQRADAQNTGELLQEIYRPVEINDTFDVY